MSESKLVTKQWWADGSNYTKGRQDKIRGIVIHHAASTSLNSIGTVFATPGRNGSAHYGVGGKEIHQYVHEADTAWHCGNWLGNSATIGIETTNSTGAPDWKVSDESLNTLITLVADIAKRNNLGKLWLDPNADYPTLSGHKDWYGSATACPGPYLYPKLQYIADKANEINYPTKPTLVWEQLAEPRTFTTLKDPTELWDFNHVSYADCKSKKSYKAGEDVEIYGKCTNRSLNTWYYIQKSDFEKQNPVGFNHGDIVLKAEPEPTPEPEPEPEDPTVGILQRIVQFIQHIIDLITRKA